MLQTAVGLVGDAHFNQSVGQRRFEIALAEGFAILQCQGLLQGL
jgi:hypothetical protein